MNSNETKTYYGNGKLLISGEYLVLDGALSLAVPCKFGQSLEVTFNKNSSLNWKSYNHQSNLWFEASFSPDFQIIQSNDPEKALVLKEIIQVICQLNPSFASTLFSSDVVTRLTFPNNWGLGSSSTLIYCICEWAQINPYTLLSKTFGGSGYDIACASASGAITFQRYDEQPIVNRVNFNPNFKRNIYFAHLGQKQISKSEIKRYSQITFDREITSFQITEITKKLLTTNILDEFCNLLNQHEEILSNILKTPSIAKRFPDVKGTFKSLGGWGGDFIMFVGEPSELDKLGAYGLTTILPWNKMVL